MYSDSFEVPDDVQIEIEGRNFKVSKDGKENKRYFKAKHVLIKKEDNVITVFTQSPKKADRADVGTVLGHIKNMTKGVRDGVTYKLKMVYSHFPMTLKVNGNLLTVENFLGEKNPRKLKILDGVEIKINGQDIELIGINKEVVGLCASQLEQVCTVNKFDRRVFQDGIYIIEKDGKSLL